MPSGWFEQFFEPRSYSRRGQSQGELKRIGQHAEESEAMARPVPRAPRQLHDGGAVHANRGLYIRSTSIDQFAMSPRVTRRPPECNPVASDFLSLGVGLGGPRVQDLRSDSLLCTRDVLRGEWSPTNPAHPLSRR